jgi:beta-glucosidase
VKVEYFANTELSGSSVHQASCQETSLAWFGETARHWDPKGFSLRMQGVFRPPTSQEYTLNLSLIGRGRLLIDQKVILDLWEGEPGHLQADGSMHLDSSRTYPFTIEYACDLDLRWRMVRLGASPSQTPDLFQEAIELAGTADLALVIAGLTPEWESEGFDREDLCLPGRQDELIREISRSNPNTVVVLNTGSPVLMPWLESVPTVLQTWYLGQESGNAIADVIFGQADPGGRLPTTFPAALKDTPAFNNYPGKAGQVHYQEGVFVGYRHYDQGGIKPLFPFGHGLSYTEFEYQELQLDGMEYHSGSKIEAQVTITNIGHRSGWEVVQLYLHDQEAALDRPPKELKGFQKIYLEPGESRKVTFTLSERDLAYFDDSQGKWIVEPGEFEVMVGRSSSNILLTSKFHWV